MRLVCLELGWSVPGSGAGLVGVGGWSKAGVRAQFTPVSGLRTQLGLGSGLSLGHLHLGSGLSQCRGWSPVRTACACPQQLICSAAAELRFLFGSGRPWPAPSC